MSPYDVSKLSGTAAIRSVGREAAETRADKNPAPASGVTDKGVTVETGVKVSAGDAPVDADRVAQIRDAIREGSYPIVPAKITDAMIAARLLLRSGQ